MLYQRPFKLLITFMPLIILIFMSAYFAKKHWNEYQINNALQHTLENIELLQTYENTVLNESLCNFLSVESSEDSKNISSKCKEDNKESAALKTIIHKRSENLEHWTNKITKIKENSSQYKLSNFEKILGSSEVVSSVKSYLDKVEYKTDIIEERELLQSYGLLSNILYAIKLENLLVSYYLSKKTAIPTSNIIFWDKIIEASYLTNFKDKKNISSIKDKLLNITENKKLQTTLSKIDDMRIDILTGKMHKSTEGSQWIQALEKKSNTLKEMTSIISKELYLRVKKHTEAAVTQFILYLSIFCLSIFALIYLYIQSRKNLIRSQALVTLVNQIQALDSYSNTKSSELQKDLDEAKDEKDIYAYIYEYFKLLNQKYNHSKQKEQAKSHFLSTLSHEIRTPLNGIIGFSKLLKDIGVTQDQEEFLSLIEGSSKNLIAIVNDVLDLSKINADKMEIENISFNIFETVESTVATFTQQAVQKDIELGVFIDPFLSHHFLGDATKLSQILTNLISNAVKFTNPYGKINIFIQSLHDDDNENEAEIKFAVSDDGIGLSEEQIKNIFNPFMQATKSTSSQYGGTGLGLAISGKMVELMGGKLEVTSKEEKGASFFFTLKLDKDKHKTFQPYPLFGNVSIGLALPAKSIKRQLDYNLKTYIQYLKAEFSLYYYEDLFESKSSIDLPDVMVFDHHYVRLEGELEQCSSLACKTVLLTNGSLHSRINPSRHNFDDIIFTPISLPKSIRILENAQKEEAKVHSLPPKTLDNIESFIGLHVLVVDDNLINRKLLNIILEKYGIKVTLACDGKEAFEKYKENACDIIFMDIQMPVMDGIESTHSILAYEKEHDLTHVPIIALTANVGTEDKEYYISEGMDDYATKPVEVDALKLIISKHCGVSLANEDTENRQD